MIVTSTLRMQLDAGGFVKNAAQLAEAVEKDVRRLNDLKAALRDTGGTDRLQSSLQKMGASATHIEAVKRALQDQRKELGIVGVAWSDLTADQKKALLARESTVKSVVRSEIAEERKLTAILEREADQRHTALLAKETSLREKLLAEDRKAEDRRVALLAAAEVSRAEIGKREAVARAIVEREITDKLKAEIKVRANASEAELATIKRVATLEREARVRAITEETAAIVAARHRQAEQEAEAMHHARARAGLGHMAAQGAAAYVSAHGVVHATREVVMQGAELQDTRLNMIRAGIEPEIRARMEQQALDLSRRYANVGQIAIMELQKDARSVLKDQHEVFNVTEILAAAKSVLDAGGGHSEGLSMLVKGAESIGAANDPERMKKLIDSYVKAIQVMGETINPEQIYQFDKYLKTAGATVSDRFLMTTGLSLSQEMGGSTAANDIFHAQKDILGGFQNKHIPLKEMMRMGLIDPSAIEYTKTGEAKGIKAGYKGVAGADLAQTDLDMWVYKYFLPALEKHGLKQEKDQLAFVQKVFTGGEGDVIAKLIQQRESFENHGVMFGKASGTAGTALNAESATAGLTALNTALGNLASNVSVEAMAPLGRGLFTVADGLNVLAQAAKDHPIASMVAGGAASAAGLAGSGWLAYQVSTGFGLPAAATSLTGAAGALDAAAAKLGAGGVVSAAEGAALPAAAGVTAAGVAAGVAAVAAPIALAIVAGQRDNAEREAYERTKDTPQAQALQDLSKQSWMDFLRGKLPGHADGGIITGPGGPRSDRVPIRVSPGEAVIPADVVRANLPLIQGLISRRAFADGGVVGLPGLSRADILSRSGAPPRVALATDSSSTTALREAVGGGMYDALRRIRNEADALGSEGGGAANLRFGHGADGGYRSTPGGRGSGGGGSAYGGTVRGGTDLRTGGGAGGSGGTIGSGDGTATTQDSGPGFTSGMRARNLGNIGYFGQKSPGLVGPSNSRDVDHSIALYATQEDGIRAAARLALRKYQSGMRNTATLIAAKKGGWTPGALGPAASVNIAKAMGLSNQDDLHLDDPTQMRKFLGALARQEHGSAGAYYTPEMIDRALKGSSAAPIADAGTASGSPVASDSSDVAAARRYLLATATGPASSTSGSRSDSISKLNPAFVLKAAEAIRRARAEGINAGIFSGYRRPDQTGSKYDALGLSSHSYGIASDFSGIGTAGSATSRRFDEITRAVGLGGYGPDNLREFNHKELGQHLQRDAARLEAMKRTLGPGGAMVDPEATWRASGYVVPKGLAKNLPAVAPAAPAPLIGRTIGGYIHQGGGYAIKPEGDGVDLSPEAQRRAEKAVLPRRAPAGASGTPHASIGLDHSPILAAIEHVDTLHRKLQGLKGVASLDINHRHRHEGAPAAARPGRLRTSLNGGYASDGRSWT